MTVHWGSLLAVFLVSLGSAVAVVALVATALWGLSARAPVVDAAAAAPRLARRAGAAVTVACLAAAALIVLFGFWVIIVR
jgi:hypothetical protein